MKVKVFKWMQVMNHILFFLLKSLRFPCCFLFAHGFFRPRRSDAGEIQRRQLRLEGLLNAVVLGNLQELVELLGGKILTAVVKPTQLKMMVVSRVIVIDYIYSDGLFDMVCQPRTFAKRSIYL